MSLEETLEEVVVIIWECWGTGVIVTTLVVANNRILMPALQDAIVRLNVELTSASRSVPLAFIAACQPSVWSIEISGSSI